METEIQYIKPNKETYKIRRRESIDEVRKVPFWLLIPLLPLLLLLLLLGGYVLFTSVRIEEAGQISYRVEGDVDYQVYLKENDYYTEKYLESGRQYIASLIDTIRTEFSYQIDTSDNINATYEYEIVAEAKATDKTDKTKVLYEQMDTLKSSAIEQVENGSFAINDNINIDYARYNDIMRNFRSDFGIAANCFLDLKLIVKVNGAIETEDVLAVNIPLSDQTIDIAIGTDANAINREERIGTAHQEIYIKNMSLLIVGCVLVIVCIVAGIMIIYLYVTRYGNNWYAEAEHKIFKSYDTRIVTIGEPGTTFYEPEDTVRVESFTELLDASDTEGAPIQYYDVDPDYKSYFVVKGLNTTYRYTLSRTYQDHLRKTGQGKEF